MTAPLSYLMLTLGLLVLPTTYYLLCQRMRVARIPQPPYYPFLFLFGTLGGWLLAFALAPSGLTALSVVLLVTVAPLTLALSAFRMWHSRTISLYHRAALYGSIGYFGCLALFACTTVLPGK